MSLLVFYVLLALSVSFMCSVMEAVLLSVTPSYVMMLEREGRPVGRRLRALKDDIDRPLAAILSLNTIAHTVGAAGAGAQAAVVFGDAAVGAFSGALTFLILVLSEIIPKTLGVTYWRALASPVARLLRPLMSILWPLVKMSQWITLLLARGKVEASTSRAEITALAEIGAQEGMLEKDESRILQNLFRFSMLRVKDIMTPRTVVFALPEAMTVGEVVERHEKLIFSRIPIYGENYDHITGLVLKDDILLKVAQDEHDLPLGGLKRAFIVVPASLALPELFKRLINEHELLAVVLDEYGGLAGVVSLEDAVETLLGTEIVDEVDTIQDLQELARRRWKSRARRLGLAGSGPPGRLPGGRLIL